MRFLESNMISRSPALNASTYHAFPNEFLFKTFKWSAKCLRNALQVFMTSSELERFHRQAIWSDSSEYPASVMLYSRQYSQLDEPTRISNVSIKTIHGYIKDCGVWINHLVIWKFHHGIAVEIPTRTKYSWELLLSDDQSPYAELFDSTICLITKLSWYENDQFYAAFLIMRRDSHGNYSARVKIARGRTTRGMILII